MALDIKRAQISALAKAMADPKLAALSHLQRIDRIAQALGFENQAALMSTLKAQEDGPSVSKSETKTEIAMVFGGEYTSALDNFERVTDDAFGEINVLTFDTPQEADCYLRGISDGNGWERYMVYQRSGPDMPAQEGTFLAERAENPDLDMIEWHNQKMDELDDEDLDDVSP